MSDRVKPKKKIDFNPLEAEFDLTTDNNFSYESVPENKKLRVYQNMQMAVFGTFVVDGELRLDGSLIIED